MRWLRDERAVERSGSGLQGGLNILGLGIVGRNDRWSRKIHH